MCVDFPFSLWNLPKTISKPLNSCPIGGPDTSVTLWGSLTSSATPVSSKSLGYRPKLLRQAWSIKSVLGRDLFLSTKPLRSRTQANWYLNAPQILQCGQDGDVLEGVFSLLWRTGQTSMRTLHFLRIPHKQQEGTWPFRSRCKIRHTHSFRQPMLTRALLISWKLFSIRRMSTEIRHLLRLRVCTEQSISAMPRSQQEMHWAFMSCRKDRNLLST